MEKCIHHYFVTMGPQPPRRRGRNLRNRRAYTGHWALRSRSRVGLPSSPLRQLPTVAQAASHNAQRRFVRRVRSLLNNPNKSKHIDWWNDTLSCSNKEENATMVQRFFPQIPRIEFISFHKDLNRDLAELESFVLNSIPSSRFSPVCRFDSSRTGINLGCTVVNGGRYSNSISAPGTIARIKSVAKVLPEIKSIVRDIFSQSFGDRKWYTEYCKKIKHYVTTIHGTEGENLLFAGLPITAVWISSVSNKTNETLASDIHVDDNVFGCSFVLTTKQIDDVQLVIEKNDSNLTVPIRSSQIIAGKWSLGKHCNLFPPNMNNRISWVFYFDRRVLQIGKYNLIVKS